MIGTIREVAAFEDTVNQDATLLAPRGHLVRPAYVLVSNDDTVRWVNFTNERLHLKINQLNVDKTSEAGADLDLTINAAKGVYDYDLRTESNKIFKGESKPEIIVK